MKQIQKLLNIYVCLDIIDQWFAIGREKGWTFQEIGWIKHPVDLVAELLEATEGDTISYNTARRILGSVKCSKLVKRHDGVEWIATEWRNNYIN